jgi:hypothetical protein
VAQRRGGLLARRADAEVRPGDQHVAALHADGEIGAQRLQAMAGDDIDAGLHEFARRQLVGIDIGADAPDAVRAPASTSRGSAMRPCSAAAATVAGDASQTCTPSPPMRPRKLRAVLAMTRLPSVSRLP